MATLYIIGNGFDLHHGLDTRYKSFATYLSKVNRSIYDLLLTYYGLPDITRCNTNQKDNAEWAAFEEKLAELDWQQVLEDNEDLTANTFSPDFRDSDWHTYQIEMEERVDDLTSRLFKVFNQFVLNVKYTCNVDYSKIKLRSDALFISFNYTDTLERYYSISEKDICYIHNKAIDDDSKLILGHGVNPAMFKRNKPTPPPGLTGDELFEWEERMADEYDYSRESAEKEILRYFQESFKNSISIIQANSKIFNQLNTIDEVIVLGHSMSGVDMEYFNAINANVDPNATWTVSFYAESDKLRHFDALTTMGVDSKRINQISINDLK